MATRQIVIDDDEEDETEVKHPLRSEKVERFLREQGVPWTFIPDAPLEEFDAEKGLRNQARLGSPLKPATVARYVEFLRAGAEFPPIIAAVDKSTRKKVTADGNHRYATFKQAGRATIPVYVVTAPPAVLVRITFLANNDNGLPLSEDEAMAHALHLIENRMSVRDAAASLGLSASAVQRERTKAEANLRAVNLGVPLRDWEALSTSTKNKLHSIGTDEGFGAACRLVRAANLSNDELGEMVGEMNKSRSAKVQVDVAGTYRDMFAERIQEGGAKVAPTKGKREHSPRSTFASALGLIAKFPDPTEIVGRYQEIELTDAIVKIDAALSRLSDVRDAFQTSKRQAKKVSA